MHLATIFTALLLPLAAVAEGMTTTTSTSTLTLTQTLTLQRAAMVSSFPIPSNGTTTSTFPSTTLSPPVSSTTTEAPLVTNDKNSGSALGPAHFAAVAVAGIVAAALL